MNRLLVGEQNEKDSVPYILTPNAPRWETRDMLGRDAFVTTLCEELQRESTHIQITGMGGIGKTEILNRIYTTFANNKEQHEFDHIGLLRYDGSMDGNLVAQLDYQGEKNVETAWNFLRRLCDSTSVLLLIDDIRHNMVQQEVTMKSDASFHKLLTLKVSVLFASRMWICPFQNKKVLLLSTEDCIQIFQKQRYLDDDTGNIPPLSEADEKIMINIIENRAGQNTLIVNRLGAMVNQYHWDIPRLEEKLNALKFSIVKGAEDNEKLQEEMDKLYRVESITKSEERNLLEAFALFPTIPLEQSTCIQWLQEDGELEEDTCTLALHSLSKRTWLVSHEDEPGSVSYSIHPLVKSCVLSQSK